MSGDFIEIGDTDRVNGKFRVVGFLKSREIEILLYSEEVDDGHNDRHRSHSLQSLPRFHKIPFHSISSHYVTDSEKSLDFYNFIPKYWRLVFQFEHREAVAKIDQVESIEKSKAALQTQIERLEKELSSSKSRERSLQNQIDTKEKKPKRDTQKSASALQKKIRELEAELAKKDSVLGGLPSQVDKFKMESPKSRKRALDTDITSSEFTRPTKVKRVDDEPSKTKEKELRFEAGGEAKEVSIHVIYNSDK